MNGEGRHGETVEQASVGSSTDSKHNEVCFDVALQDQIRELCLSVADPIVQRIVGLLLSYVAQGHASLLQRLEREANMRKFESLRTNCQLELLQKSREISPAKPSAAPPSVQEPKRPPSTAGSSLRPTTPPAAPPKALSPMYGQVLAQASTQEPPQPCAPSGPRTRPLPAEIRQQQYRQQIEQQQLLSVPSWIRTQRERRTTPRTEEMTEDAQAAAKSAPSAAPSGYTSQPCPEERQRPLLAALQPKSLSGSRPERDFGLSSWENERRIVTFNPEVASFPRQVSDASTGSSRGRSSFRQSHDSDGARFRAWSQP